MDRSYARAFRLLKPHCDRLFPKTFQYVFKGPDGDCSKGVPLFGDLVAAVELAVDLAEAGPESWSRRVPDLAPGTYAQPHSAHLRGDNFRSVSSSASLAKVMSSQRSIPVSPAMSSRATPSRQPSWKQPNFTFQTAKRRPFQSFASTASAGEPSDHSKTTTHDKSGRSFSHYDPASSKDLSPI